MRSLILLGTFAMLLGRPALAETVFFVAPNGNDTNPGTEAAPFASVARARDAVRQLKDAGPLKAPVTVYLRGGIYSVPEKLTFEARDGGTAQAPVTYRAFAKEQPILVGGRTITGFTTYKGSILKTDVAGQGFKGVYFRQLVFDGKRQHLARFPNFDPQNPYGGGWSYADGKFIPMYQDVPDENKRVFTYKAQDARNWTRPEELEVFVFPRYNWWNNICRVQGIDCATRQITLAQSPSYAVRPGDRYYVQNALEELDAPGEWYLDKQSWTLYFWPPAPLAGKAVVAPTTRVILELGKGISHLVLRGLTFECAEGSAVTMTEASNCLVAACTIRNVGDYHGSGVTISGGTGNGVRGCDIYEIGSNGVSVGGGDRKTLTPGNNFADNNYIHHIGVYHKQGVGVSLTGVGNRASHNLIHDGPRWGIGFTGNNQLLEYNHIRHVNLETADTGAVYTGGRDWLGSRGTVIRYNYFHDILGYGFENGHWVSPHYSWGVYLDDNTGGVDVFGNIVARTVRGLIHLHNGRDNHVENNIFIDGRNQQMECSGWTQTSRNWKTHLPTMITGYESVANLPAWRTMRNMGLHPTNAVLPDGKIMSGNTFFRNIVYYHGTNSKYTSFKNFPFDHNQCDSNLVWHLGQPILTGQRIAGKEISANLVANGGFEDGSAGDAPKDWRWQIHTPNAKAVVVETGAAAGRRALRLDAAFAKDKARDNYPILVGRDLELPLGHQYKLSGKFKATVPGAKAALMLQSYVANAYFWASPGDLKPTTEWQNFEFSFALPAQGEKGWHEKMKTFRVRLDFKSETGALFVDEISLKEVAVTDEWASWQALGMDRHAVIADPLFVNPDKDDYRLKPESPAFKLGFQPIPVEKIGPYADESRATWPIVEAEGAREKPLVTPAQ